MKSIKRRLIIGISLILSIFLGGIVLYGITFKGYFKELKLKEMMSLVRQIEEKIAIEEIKELQNSVNILADNNNLQIEIKSITDGTTLCETVKNGKNSMMGHGMGGKNRYETVQDLGKVDDISKIIIYDKSSGITFLTVSKESVTTGYHIILRTPINAIDDSIKKSFTLLIIIFIPITIIVFIITLIFAKRFTKPIVDIREKTARIQKLDFKGKLNIKGNDEISELAKSVNVLSDSIEHALVELNNKNNELQKYINKEKENEVLRREFVSSVSHELKSPVAVISGYAQVLGEGIKEGIDTEYYVSIINEEALRMQVIINDLLDLYKLESNSFKLNMKEVNLKDLLENTIRKNQISFYKNKIKVKFNGADIKAICDEIRIEQVVRNFINNAISHVDNSREIIINLSEDGKITVFNTGNNIEKENLENIWHGFFRADKVRNYKENRVGLGLAIVRQIMILHNGSYGVNNLENGVGFWIKLNIIES